MRASEIGVAATCDAGNREHRPNLSERPLSEEFPTDDAIRAAVEDNQRRPATPPTHPTSTLSVEPGGAAAVGVRLGSTTLLRSTKAAGSMTPMQHECGRRRRGTHRHATEVRSTTRHKRRDTAHARGYRAQLTPPDAHSPAMPECWIWVACGHGVWRSHTSSSNMRGKSANSHDIASKTYEGCAHD